MKIDDLDINAIRRIYRDTVAITLDEMMKGKSGIEEAAFAMLLIIIESMDAAGRDREQQVQFFKNVQKALTPGGKATDLLN
jgi:hypothetical protein